MFSQHKFLSIMPSHKTSFTELVSSAMRQSLLYFAFSPSFIMTCLFSAFLRTLALTSTVSYRSFPCAWVIVHSWLLKLSLKENDREAGEIFACFAMANSSSCVWNLFDGECFTVNECFSLFIKECLVKIRALLRWIAYSTYCFFLPCLNAAVEVVSGWISCCLNLC